MNYDEDCFYYYLREERNGGMHRIGCVAFMKNSDGTVTRGVSMCSRLDKFDSNKAKAIAKKMMIASDKGCLTLVSSDYRGKNRTSPVDMFYKCKYHDAPTSEEMKIMNFSK